MPSRRVRLGRIEPAAVAMLTAGSVIVVVCFRLPGRIRSSGVIATVYLALLAFIISVRFSVASICHTCLQRQIALSGLAAAGSRVLVRWGAIVASLLFLAFVFRDTSALFSRRVLLTWFLITPVALCLLQAVRLRARWFAGQMPTRRYIIVGVNEVGLELARRLPAK
jgi:hypothetical protein